MFCGVLTIEESLRMQRRLSKKMLPRRSGFSWFALKLFYSFLSLVNYSSYANSRVPSKKSFADLCRRSPRSNSVKRGNSQPTILTRYKENGKEKQMVYSRRSTFTCSSLSALDVGQRCFDLSAQTMLQYFCLASHTNISKLPKI